MTELAGKVAICTGGTKGIGKAVALQLLAQGAKVIVTYRSDTPGAESFKQDVGSDNLTIMQADSVDLADVDKLVQGTIDKYKKIDIVVPNAGLLPMTDMEHLDEAIFDKAFATNVKGPLFLVQKSLPHMGKDGRVVFLSTTQNFASTVSAPYLLYCATKGAIDQATRVLAKDIGRRGITVNCIAPGPTGTELFFEGKSEELVKQIGSFNPFGRIGKPDEIASAIKFLCSGDASWVNGQIIKVNGGHYVG